MEGSTVSVIESPPRESISIGARHDRSSAPWDSMATAAIWAVIAYTTIKNIFAAASKPFWFDELMTVAVAHQPSFPSLWKALLQAKDSSPLLFCLLEHFCAVLIPNEQIAYRLPSILGFGCVLWCLFVFVRRQQGSACAFLCALIPIFTPLYRHYAIEARAYVPVVACISIALVCYQHLPSRSWTICFGLALACAEALHFYAFFSFVPFAIAEIARFAKEKRIRWGAILALGSAILPLLIFWPVLREVKDFYGADFWSKATFSTVQDAYDGFLKPFRLLLFPGIGFIFAAGLSAAAILSARLSKSAEHDGSKDRSLYEPLLAVGLLAVPFVAFVVTKIGKGPLTGRYFLPMTLGMAIAASYVMQPLRNRGIVLLGVIVVLLLGIGNQERHFWKEESGHLARLPPITDSLAALLNSSGHSDLPVIVSDGQEYIQFAYYAPAGIANRLIGVVDPPSAVAYIGYDSIDRELLAVTCCLEKLHVFESSVFEAGHPSFLVYSDGSDFARWSTAFRRDGYRMEQVATAGDKTIYWFNRNPESHLDSPPTP
jgi:hypothetical protein